MTTERLFEFTVLSQTLSYSKTAKKLFITQSALSRHILEMERELGVTLLDRNTHGMRLTEAGRAVAQAARALLQKYDSAVSRLRVAGLETTGSVVLACTESTACDQLLHFLRQFNAQYPQIDFRVDVVQSAERAAQLERCDFLFSAFELQNLPSTVVSRLAFRDPGVLAVVQGSPLMLQRHVSLEDLADKTLLVPYADELFCSYAANRQLAEKLTGNRVNIVKVPTPESALLMTTLGRGATILPQHMIHNTINHSVILDITTPGCVFDTWLYWNQARANPAARRFFEEFEFFTAHSEN